MIFTMAQWYEMVIGKKIDTDNYPRNNPFQCWDVFDFFCRKIGFNGSRKCSITNYVCDLWKLKDEPGYSYSSVFEYVNPANLKKGDWLFWDAGSSCPFGHVGMLWENYGNGYGLVLGQNQGATLVNVKKEKLDVLGGLRWKGWDAVTIPYGSSDLIINGHKYYLYRQNPRTEKVAVVAKGLNEVAPIKELDINKLIYAKVGGANYFQMREGQYDPVGTTYGDISSPLTGAYQNLPNQDSTLFYDLTDVNFGDCAFHEVDRTHDVFSPALVFPNANGNFEYARMVGLSHIGQKSRFSFVIRFNDGYCLGLAEDELTPKEIAEDFQQTDMVNIAFLDGGGSAQLGRWNGTEFEYVRDTGRAIPSVVCIYREAELVNPVEDENPVEEPSEETPVDEPEKPEEDEVPEAQEDEEDMKEDMNPEQKTIKGQIANLIDVKSIMTIILVCTLCYLVVSDKELNDKFMTIVTAVVTFYFSYQVKKQ